MSPLAWLALLVLIGMGLRGFALGFSRSLARLGLMLVALLPAGTLLKPLAAWSGNWLDWPAHWQQLAWGALVFALCFALACRLLDRWLSRMPAEARPGLGSRLAGLALGLVAGTAIAAVLALLMGVRPDLARLGEQSARLEQGDPLPAEDGFAADTEAPVSRLIQAVVYAPARGVVSLQRLSQAEELHRLLAAQLDSLAVGDLARLRASREFQQLLASAPMQSLWQLQREQEPLSRAQLEADTAAQLLDAYQRISRLRHHPRVADMLADSPFRHFLQTASPAELGQDARVLELGALLLGLK